METDLMSVLRKAGDLELKMRDLYDYYARIFSEHEDAGGVFRELREEEQAHYDLIQYQRRIVLGEKELFTEVNVDLSGVDRLGEDIESAIRSSVVPTLRDAMGFALSCESNAAEYHHRHAMQLANPEMAKLIRNLGGSDLKHLEALKTLARRWGLPDA